MSLKGIRLAVGSLLFLASVPFFGREPEIQFTDVTSQAGLRAPLDGMMAHAAAWGDIDRDGDLDLYVGSFGDRPDTDYLPARGPIPNRLFRNQSNGRFEQVANPAVELYGRTSDAVFVDLDNDGGLDLYVANNTQTSSSLSGLQRNAQLNRSAVFRNDRGAFVDVSDIAGECLTASGATRSVGVLDYDLDGALDLLILEDRFEPHPRTRLCRNLGDFRFSNVTADVGLPANLFGLGLAIADLNNDRRPDIFVTHSNRLFLTTSGNRYVEPPGPRDTLAWRPQDAEDWPGGAVFGDLNRDGLPDLVVGIHHDRARNRVYLNDGLKHGVPVFRDVSAAAGLPARLHTKSPHVEVQDFDNDGWPDLYFSAAWLDVGGEVTPLVFRNLGAQRGLPRFDPLRQMSSGGPRVYFPAGPSGDYDADGRVDLFLANWFRGNHSRLLRNVSPKNQWLDVRVTGRTINRMGIGTKLRVYEPGGHERGAGILGFQEIGTGSGFASSQLPIAHFGLGSVAVVDVVIEFPDGSNTLLKGVEGGRRLTVEGP